MFRSWWRAALVVAVSTSALAACVGGDETASEATVCAESARTVLFDEQLRMWEPGASFTIPTGSKAFLAVTSDAAYNPRGVLGALSRISAVFVIDDGGTPDITILDEEQDSKRSNDERYSSEEFFEFQLIRRPPGEYQVYSHRSPVVQVVSCRQ